MSVIKQRIGVRQSSQSMGTPELQTSAAPISRRLARRDLNKEDRPPTRAYVQAKPKPGRKQVSEDLRQIYSRSKRTLSMTRRQCRKELEVIRTMVDFKCWMTKDAPTHSWDESYELVCFWNMCPACD